MADVEIPTINVIQGKPTDEDRKVMDLVMNAIGESNQPLLGRKKVLAIYGICLVEVAEGRARLCITGQALSPQLLECLREVFQKTNFTQTGEMTRHPLPKAN